MSNKLDLKSAKMIYEQLCRVLDARDWNYDKYDDKYGIHFEVRGEDIPMEFLFSVDLEKQIVYLKSMLPFKFAEDKRIDGAIVVSRINCSLADGYYEYDITDGEMSYKITTSCRDSLLSDATIEYMLNCALFVVEEFNDKIMAVSKGYMTVQHFLKDS